MKAIFKAALLAGAAWSVVPTLAVAQVTSNAAVGVVEELVVTARRREESLKDVPVAVTAITAERLALVGATDITTLQQTTPNVTVQVARGSNSTLISFIRGIGQLDPLWCFEPGVGLYIDDVYVARPQAAVLEHPAKRAFVSFRNEVDPAGLELVAHGDPLDWATERLEVFGESDIPEQVPAGGRDGRGAPIETLCGQFGGIGAVGHVAGNAVACGGERQCHADESAAEDHEVALVVHDPAP